jgi:hypothetical protein
MGDRVSDLSLSRSLGFVGSSPVLSLFQKFSRRLSPGFVSIPRSLCISWIEESKGRTGKKEKGEERRERRKGNREGEKEKEEKRSSGLSCSLCLVTKEEGEQKMRKKKRRVRPTNEGESISIKQSKIFSKFNPNNLFF